ncbi:MAG: D-alanyl-D-alanine carboxypeptidase [Clostridiales bacterium]|nr:D-alanyl-D-alanine carboxypeptidase [Clostridiales bacterium]
MRRILALLLLPLLFIPTATAAADTPIPGGAVRHHSAAAILIEAASGRVLYAHNAESKLPMASTTKVMTCLLALEMGDLDALVSVADAAIGVEPSSMYLQKGEKIALRDLLYGLMLLSANDAAVAIACHLDGSVAAFAARMNARAKELGCENTNFVNPNGLPAADHYTTARELAILCAAAMQNETFREIIGTEYYVTKTGNHARQLKNKNRLLWSFDGANGIKTGYTRAAGKCLTFAAERDGLQLVGVLLHSGDMWGDAKALLNAGFAAVELRDIVDANVSQAKVQVQSSTTETLELYPREDYRYPMRRDGKDEIRVEIQAASHALAPVPAGQTLGHVYVYLNGNLIWQTELAPRESAGRYGLKEYWQMLVGEWVA